MSSLENIKQPEDIKALSIEELETLSLEIRTKIIEVLSINGGHLSSNLGIVELSIALHYVFNSPIDKFIFDVSHQCYTHKLLTGRYDQFATIRQFKGLCGFSHPKESIHDHFYLGHAGTALSIALGLCKNRDLSKRDEHVIPIIGDASLTCGLTLEALNNIDKDLKKFVIILNDNKMAISKNVGNIKQILSRLINNPTSNKVYLEIQNLLSKIPTYGKAFAKQGQKITESIKNLVSPAPFFENHNLSYVGPIDGHDIKKLIDTFEKIKDTQTPTIVHVITNKGQGLSHALQNPTSFHGAKPFNIDTGKFLPSKAKSTFPKIFGKHILKMAENDPSVVAINPAMTAGSCLNDFMKIFPERCLDVGIAEGHAITLAGGMAFGKKMKVVVNIYSTFLQRAFDNLFHDVCLQELPVMFAIDRAGISGPDGATHHGIYDISFLNAMPNMIIAQPRNGHVLKELLESAFSYSRPIAIRYPNQSTEDTSEPLKLRKLSKGEILNHGNDIAIIAVGHMYKIAFEVKEILSKHNINITIVDPIFIKPLDSELFYELLQSHKKVVTIEEHSVNCGFGAIFNNFIVQNNFHDIQILNLGIPDTFVQHGNNADIYKDLSLDAKSVAKKILNTFDMNIAQKVKL